MWFKVDDELAFHRKTMAAGNAAMGLWVRAGSWLRKPGNSRPGLPGVLTVAEARTMGTAAEIQRLLDAGLWHKTTVQGVKAVRFNDWAEYQPNPDELEDRRNVWADRKKRQRHHRAGNHDLCDPRYCDDAEPEPDDEESG